MLETKGDQDNGIRYGLLLYAVIYIFVNTLPKKLEMPNLLEKMEVELLLNLDFWRSMNS